MVEDRYVRFLKMSAPASVESSDKAVFMGKTNIFNLFFFYGNAFGYLKALLVMYKGCLNMTSGVWFKF